MGENLIAWLKSEGIVKAVTKCVTTIMCSILPLDVDKQQGTCIYIYIYMIIMIINKYILYIYIYIYKYEIIFFIYIYIYIYIYILSSTDRLFRSIRTLQCG